MTRCSVSDLLRLAKSQLGTCESPPNSNRIKYNTWYYGREVSGTDYPWCMVFVQWCFALCGAPLPYRSASCKWTLEWWRKNKPGCVVARPMPGDIVIYNYGHTGIVESVPDSGHIVAIEGNTAPDDKGSQSNGGMVCRKRRSVTSVTAYIRPDYKEDKPMVYNKYEDIPAAYQPTIKKLIDAGALRGKDGNLELDRNMCRLLTMIDRMGVFR